MEDGAAGACPVCGRARRVRAQNQAFPFCSAACKLVDLGRWLDGVYRVAGPMAVDADEAHTSPEEDG